VIFICTYNIYRRTAGNYDISFCHTDNGLTFSAPVYTYNDGIIYYVGYSITATWKIRIPPRKRRPSRHRTFVGIYLINKNIVFFFIIVILGIGCSGGAYIICNGYNTHIIISNAYTNGHTYIYIYTRRLSI